MDFTRGIVRSVMAGGTITVCTVFGSCERADDPVSGQDTIAGKIVFVSNRETADNVFQLFVMDVDGTHIRRLTHDSNNYFCPHFSPDGTRILFYSQNGIEDEIYLIDTSGENLVNVTRSPGNDRLPQFSADGSKIVFVSDRDGNREIYLMNVDGSHQERLTHNLCTDQGPQFSPDGRKILFYSTVWNPYNYEHPESYDLYTIDLDGGQLTKLTPDSGYFHFSARDDSPSILDAEPRYSPEGSRIVFQNYRHGEFIISMMSADGSNCLDVVSASGVDFAPFFYPDRQQILFRSHRDGDFDLYRMRLQGGGEHIRVTDDNGHTFFGDFSDDGTGIVYFSDIDEARAEYYHIYTANADGSNRVKLTHGDFADYFPEFQPVR